MSAEIIELDSQRPHLVVDCGSISGVVHVVPVSVALDWASGKQALPTEDILRRVITEWLCFHCPQMDYPDDAA